MAGQIGKNWTGVIIMITPRRPSYDSCDKSCTLCSLWTHVADVPYRTNTVVKSTSDYCTCDRLGDAFRDTSSNVSQCSQMEMGCLLTLSTCWLKDSVSSMVTPSPSPRLYDVWSLNSDGSDVNHWLKWPGQALGLRGWRRQWGWGIWHILCIKEHFFINSRGLKLEHGTEPPWLPHFNYLCQLQWLALQLVVVCQCRWLLPSCPDLMTVHWVRSNQWWTVGLRMQTVNVDRN